MRRTGILAILALVAACAACAMTACSGNGATNNGDNDVKDVCTGDLCDVTGDAEVDQETSVPPDEVTHDEEVTPPPDEVELSCDECAEGEILCKAGGVYLTCKQDDKECWVWQDKTTCAPSTVCVCLVDDDKELDSCALAGGNDPCVCEPQCDEVECGPDSCGGVCGNQDYVDNDGCEPGTEEEPIKCVDGVCKKQPCDPDPPEGPTEKAANCDAPPCGECGEGETLCNGPKIQTCEDIHADWEFDPKKVCNLFGDALDCPEGKTCIQGMTDECACVPGIAECGGLCCLGPDYVCDAGDACCLPDCADKECGEDGCGGFCGNQDPDTFGCDEGLACENGKCVECSECVATCNNVGEIVCADAKSYQKCQKVCGDCFKFGPAIYCGDNKECNNVTGICECVPNCKDEDGNVLFECGDDGCGGSCGSCPDPKVCTPEGKCGCNCADFPDNAYVCDLKNKKTYNNGCLAECAGVTDYAKGSCDVACQDTCTEEEKKIEQGICGIDWVTYSSFCDLKCAIGTEDCKDKYDCPQIKYLGACKPNPCPGCPSEYDPVCGSDGKTYYNKCSILLEGDPLYCGGAKVEITCFGECLDQDQCPACADNCDSVCGTLGITEKTFLNGCQLECQGGVFIDDGRCCPECKATAEEWVCSPSYKAYLNECTLQCKDIEDSPSLYVIPQNPDGTWQIEVCEECQCDLIEDNVAPVCGSNYVTYANQCALQCANQKYPKKVKPDAVCENECGPDTCPCPVATGGYAIETELTDPPTPGDDGKRGVCGADGNTYGNVCSAVYSGTYVVKEIWCDACAENCANTSYSPICCEDGVTYPNSCIPTSCNTKLNVSKCNKGKCCFDAADCDDGNPDTTDTCSAAGVCENV